MEGFGVTSVQIADLFSSQKDEGLGRGRKKRSGFPNSVVITICTLLLSKCLSRSLELHWVKKVKRPDGMRDKTIYICIVWLCKGTSYLMFRLEKFKDVADTTAIQNATLFLVLYTK